jgi:dipeptidyl aminopeptidase/acylaminoacyl peptidase
MLKRHLKSAALLAAGILCGVGLANYRAVKSGVRTAVERLSPAPAWLRDFSLEEIPCSYDGGAGAQKAWLYRTRSMAKAPLVVSLHPWSSDYTYIENPTSLAKQAREADWNFIYPDFRGTNDTPQAVMSDAVLADIDDAIAWALRGGNVDESRIVVVGLSGGGMAALGVYARSRHPLRYCMAWCPISDLEAWYYQSQNAGTKYWRDIAAAAGSGGALDAGAARARSPLYFDDAGGGAWEDCLRFLPG